MWFFLKKIIFTKSGSFNQLYPQREKNAVYIEIAAIQFSLVIFFTVLFGEIYYYFLFFLIPLGGAKIVNDLRVFIEHYDSEMNTGCLKNIGGPL